ncbi:MAG: aldo/keto reductase [Candidatus Melainabacteria bacterium]
MTATPRIPGHATAEGTRRYADRMLAERQATGSLNPGHFREDFQNLILTSLGMGSYLGQPSTEDDTAMREAVVASVGSGAVNVLDTAINYRLMASERSFGEALRQLMSEGFQRDEIFVASKNGFITPDAAQREGDQRDFRTWFQQQYLESGLIELNDIAGGMHCMAPAFLDDQLNRSLENLGLETLDLMYLHNAAESQLPLVGRETFLTRLREAFAFYETMRRAGKIRFYGMATWNCFRVPPDHPEYLALTDVVALAESVGGAEHGFRYIQLPFNLAFVEALAQNDQPMPSTTPASQPGDTTQHGALLEAAMALKIGVFTSVPLLQGQLLAHGPLPDFPKLSTDAQRCLQFVRSTPGVIAPLVGQKTLDHVADNLAVAATAPLPFADLQTYMAAAV